LAQQKGIDLSQTGKINIDMRTLVGIVLMILSVAGVYFTLQGQLAQLQLDVVRMQDATNMNTEFRIKWPRGELGALPDDAKQDLKIEYLQKDMTTLQNEIKEIEDHIDKIEGSGVGGKK
tara:strand:+ start:27 stop:383 length:357 start_codon:yes stop_codon:yes gene_type:complete